MLIEFRIGDWSRDGHEKCDSYYVESNRTSEEIGATFAKTGFGEITPDYEDHHLSESQRDYLRRHNIKYRPEYGDGDDVNHDDYWFVSTLDVLNIGLLVVKNADTGFEYTVLETKQVSYCFGGYGAAG